MRRIISCSSAKGYCLPSAEMDIMVNLNLKWWVVVMQDTTGYRFLNAVMAPTQDDACGDALEGYEGCRVVRVLPHQRKKKASEPNRSPFAG
jgi:hypothetical protein